MRGSNRLSLLTPCMPCRCSTRARSLPEGFSSFILLVSDSSCMDPDASNDFGVGSIAASASDASEVVWLVSDAISESLSWFSCL